MWDLSKLYTTGEVTLENLLLPGDLSDDGHVNVADISALMAALTNLSAYQSTNNLTAPQLLQIADLTGDNLVTNVDLQRLIVNLANSGGTGGGSVTAVPEPMTISLLAIGATAALPLARRRRPHKVGVSWACPE
jgi:hypothetical protein